MAKLGPLLEFVNEEQIHAGKDFLRCACPVVACPAANEGIEVFDECGLGAAPVLANDLLAPFEVAFLRFPAGFDDRSVTRDTPEGAGVVLSHPMLPDVETQEVKPNLSIVLI